MAPGIYLFSTLMSGTASKTIPYPSLLSQTKFCLLPLNSVRKKSKEVYSKLLMYISIRTCPEGSSTDMSLSNNSILPCLFFLICASATAFAEPPVLFHVYVTAGQVEQRLSTPADRQAASEYFAEIGVDTVFIETMRSGREIDTELLVATRDDLLAHGFSVSAGVATTNGADFGVPSSTPGIWFNYEAEKTRNDLAAHIRRIAAIFDEIIIDDFWATDDESELSRNAKGERSWSEYRLDLMPRVSEESILAPAREANPNVRVILKYPQWYDRFHRFGYEVERQPRLYDRIWVGTETRDPTTQRFGFVMPTQGYINYLWLKSLADERVGGAWFDFGDCTPQVFLMQAYQSVLAGARELMLFEAGSLLDRNPCADLFLQRRDAVTALGALLAERNPIGHHAYKPPNSEGSDVDGAANLYLFDYLAVLGMNPIPTAMPPHDPRVIILGRHAADDPDILRRCGDWLDQGAHLIVTPDFLIAADEEELFSTAGYDKPFTLSLDTVPVMSYHAQNTEIPVENDDLHHVRPIPVPQKSEIIAWALTELGEVPIFSHREHQSGGGVSLLNIQTFTHEEFAPDREQFLPPRPLPYAYWPDQLAMALKTWPLPLPFMDGFELPNNIGVSCYQGGIVVLANFSDETAHGLLYHNDPQDRLKPIEDFPHADGFEYHADETEDGVVLRLTIPAWEIAALSRN